MARKTKPIYYCQLCGKDSPRGAGLAAHIRGQHKDQLAAWSKNPNRMQEALTPPSGIAFAGRTQSAGKPAGRAVSANEQRRSPGRPRKPQTAAKETVMIGSDQNGATADAYFRMGLTELYSRRNDISSRISEVESLKAEVAKIDAQIAIAERLVPANDSTSTVIGDTITDSTQHEYAEVAQSA